MPTIQTITRTLYTFAELLDAERDGAVSYRAVDRAREWLSDGACDDMSYMIDDLDQTLEEYGIELDRRDVEWRVSWSQGDGAAFGGRVSDSDAFLKKSGLEATYPACSSALRSGRITIGFKADRLYQLTSVDDHEWNDPDYLSAHERLEEQMLSDEFAGFEKAVSDLAHSLANDLYRSMRNEVEYQTSDEVLAETAKCNGWMFDEEGRIAS